MLKILSLSLCLASFSLASEVDLNTPSRAVQSYYDAINEGDLNSLSKVMVKESYDTDVQVYALSIALKNKEFHKTLKQYSESETAKQSVLQAVEKKLQNRKKRDIVINKEVPIGKNRVMVRFSENLKPKQLYLSHHPEGWKIDYLAGRKTN
ncbi:hypothetical protein [Sulfurimonas sp.]|uniref:hypothetical protein n=1 Tax=Sulfurimonas sp. TaxID=2022749 RepID=UPI0035665B4A